MATYTYNILVRHPATGYTRAALVVQSDYSYMPSRARWSQCAADRGLLMYSTLHPTTSVRQSRCSHIHTYQHGSVSMYAEHTHLSCWCHPMSGVSEFNVQRSTMNILNVGNLADGPLFIRVCVPSGISLTGCSMSGPYAWNVTVSSQPLPSVGLRGLRGRYQCPPGTRNGPCMGRAEQASGHRGPMQMKCMMGFGLCTRRSTDHPRERDASRKATRRRLNRRDSM